MPSWLARAPRAARPPQPAQAERADIGCAAFFRHLLQSLLEETLAGLAGHHDPARAARWLDDRAQSG